VNARAHLPGSPNEADLIQSEVVELFAKQGLSLIRARERAWD